MKYLLIIVAQLLLALYLIVERSMKCVVSVLIVLWSFKFDKNEHKYRSCYHFVIPFIFPTPILWFHALTLKQFFTLPPTFRGL